ncbi:MerR family transcriptional regulator [Gottfriedia sp. NPDC056225]|uniref:MerR family transcriptional regulator n=1 Tax=Gottfriedia sp. NPDC056225 TaxID=3345751 RepID=UPI0015599C08|nr:MerR family transcriptional regulator [Arthrobacter citreus]
MNYTIGQVAKFNNLSISQLRYYDNQGLLPFLKRAESGDRIFDEDALKFIEMILCLKNTGMPIKKIKQFVDWTMNGEETLKQRLDLMKQQENNVLEQIKESQENLEKIRRKIAKYEFELNNKN